MGEVRTAQAGPGPIPDLQLTPTATASEELYPNSAPQGELNRIVISSNGVDENGDGEFDPGVTADDFNLWLLRTDGSLVTQLTQMPGDELYPEYGPGGRLVAFSNNSSGTWQIYTVEVLTGTIRQITSGPGNKHDPTWSPDGLRFAFSGDLNRNRDIFVMPSDGSEAPQPIVQTPAEETQPAWTRSVGVIRGPILFTRSGTGMGSRIFRVDPDGGNEEQVTNGGGDPAANDRDPAWRHNGQLIAFSSNRRTEAMDADLDYNIWTVVPAGEDAVDAQLRSNLDPEDTFDDRYPCFNPGLDPRLPVRIFFTSWRPDQAGAEPDIWRFEVSDPVPPQLMALPYVDARRRLVTPGNDVTVHVEVFDRDSGVAHVVAQFKDPDSAVDDSQGRENKIFGPYPGASWSIEPVEGTGQLELDCREAGQAELFDDGDPEHGDAVEGDGIFSGKWTTPLSPSDFIIDIVVQDVAGNAFEYDDVYGFTTLMFQPQYNVLLVDDYCEGQGFIWNASWENNDFPTVYPVESYYTTNPGDSEEADNEAYNTFIDGVSGPPRRVLGERYDLWRVICRGPITMNDLIYYLPATEVQLSVPDMQDLREVLVANRCVVWAAPHTGDVWAGPGSLVDASTQATLATFLDRGGRLMMSGQDIGFALTLDGTVQNNFYTNYLHANYVEDSADGGCFLIVVSLGQDDRLPDAYWPPEVNGVDGDPVARHPGWTFYTYPPLTMQTGVHEISNECRRQDCAQYTLWSDVIEPVGGATVTHTYSTEGNAGLRYEQPGGGYRVIYFAWGFEQTHRTYDVVDPQEYGVCLNFRSKLMHNCLCHLRTAGFQGRVLSISDGNQPINDPTPVVQAIQGGNVIAAVRCEEDGRYVMGGLAPGVYTLRAHRPGFEIDHQDNEEAHGGGAYPVIDFAITRAAPGAIRGTVTALATGEPLATVEVCAYEAIQPEPEDEEENGDGGQQSQAEPAQNGDGDEDEGPQRGELIACTTTDADGTYLLGDIPVGEVIVVADGSHLGYDTEESVVTVTSGNTTTLDFALGAAPGTVIATVTDIEDNPITNALVEILTDGTLMGQGVTDDSGQVRIEVQPGTYSVEAAAAGFQRSDPQPVQVEAAATQEVTIPLQSEPPGSISGLISRGLTGEPVGGITVHLLVNEQIIDAAVSEAEVTRPQTGAPYNYRFDAVPTGQIVVEPDPQGFTVSPQRRIVTVTSGEETDAVNFSVSSIRTFPAGLQLISLPYDYPNTDPAALLGADAANFKMAAWEPRDGRYHIYPSTPADRFRLGSGYWMKPTATLELTQEGIEAGDQHQVPLDSGQSGWNLIGDFFTDAIDFFSLEVRDRTGIVYTMQQAMAEGLVRSPLFTYVLGAYETSAVAEPFVGYWLNVSEGVDILGNRLTDTLADDGEASRAAVTNPEGGWLIPVVVSSAGMRDASTWIGCAPSATEGFDAGMDMLKPPPPGMGSCVYAAAGEGSYAVDVRPEAAGTTWTVSVMAPAGEQVEVRWPDLSSLPADVRPVLVDPAAGNEVYMRTVQGYELAARADARELEIVLADDGGCVAVSAPSARAAGAGAEITYTLSAAASVQVRVLNIAGRVVDTVIDGSMQRAGVQRVVWDRSTSTGTRAPNGTYLVVVTAEGESGQKSQAMGTMRLGR
ncbi:MAG: carboxypeptidase regulatory-like domain-containing protein [Armatimonadota bacterium]|nr:carboxypeptidase regulatory-like domain-containing protein [Armatimonadota bacterium]